MYPTDNNSTGPQIAFIGGGNMAASLIGGLVDSGGDASGILVCEPDAAGRQRLADTCGIATTDDNLQALNATSVVLAVKPQQLRDVCRQLADNAGERRPTFISIAAGVRSDTIDRWLGGDRAVVRCMPNTPALLRCGATGMYANERVNAAARDAAENILASVGITVWVDNESLLDAVTAVSGSGPAYYFLMMEAMQEAAVELGLDAGTAGRLVAQTALGAARMNAENPDGADTLRKRVTSKGGTTEKAIDYFEQAGFRSMVKQALTAASDRSAELARELAGAVDAD